MKIETKKIKNEIRFFAEEADPGFDGTANGYGFKSVEKLKKSYWFFQNKDRLKNLEMEAKDFLKQNPDVKQILNDYFDADWCIDRFCDGEEATIENLIEDFKEDHPELVEKLLNAKHLWKSFMRI